jgi:DNA-binding NarL/FixJ family response regulator
MARISIADDYEGIRSILHVLLQDYARREICGEAATNSEAMQKSIELKPDVLVKDWVSGREQSGNNPGDRETSSGYCASAVLVPRPP